jgi:hypothetical protein
VEVNLGYKILVFPVGEMWPVMRNFSFNCMLATPLALPELAGVLTAINATFMEESAIGQFVLNAVKFIHLLSVIFTAEIAKYGLSVALRRASLTL